MFEISLGHSTWPILLAIAGLRRPIASGSAVLDGSLGLLPEMIERLHLLNLEFALLV